MRYHLFLHYGWFLQNLGKDFIQTNMHTTVYVIWFWKTAGNLKNVRFQGYFYLLKLGGLKRGKNHLLYCGLSYKVKIWFSRVKFFLLIKILIFDPIYLFLPQQPGKAKVKISKDYHGKIHLKLRKQLHFFDPIFHV